jgi:hypothetical protein
VFKILFFTFVALFVASRVADAVCTPPSFYDGFSGQFFNHTTSGFIYGLDETYLYVTFTDGSVSGFEKVPQSTATAFLYSKDPDNFYLTQVKPLYTENFTCGDPL